MATTNSIALTTAGIVGYDGAGTFTSTAVTNTNVLIGGGSSSTLNNVAPPTNVGTPLISNGTAGTPPIFGTCQVRGGGTGLATLTTYQLMASGTTSTGDMQQISSGTSGQILVSSGSGALPLFKTVSAATSWTDSSGSFSVGVNSGYFCTATLTATLPGSPTQGQLVTFVSDTSGTITVQANTGQFIRTSSGVSSSGGTATNTGQGSSLTLVYRASSTTWFGTSVEGTWSLA